MDHRNASIQ